MRKCMHGRHSYTLACAVSICLASLFARARSPPPPCSLPAWPGEEVVSSWEHHGSRERCFCAYAALAAHAHSGTPRLRELEESCPRWADFVSLDGGHSATMVHASGAFAIALGSISGNVSERKYGYVPDWAADLGSGYGEDCDLSRDPRCEAVGAHVLSLPRRLYVADCCSRPDAARGDATVVAARRPGPQPGPSLADLIASDAASACGLLQDLVAGGLRQVRRLDAFGSCAAENEEPTAASGCLAQCFHVVPDVWYLHLHTTAGAKDIRAAQPYNTGLGPSFNASEASDPATAFGRYNACVCEPRAWAAAGRGRGSCPEARPSDAAYPAEAAHALCRNVAGASGVDPRLCHACRPPASTYLNPRPARSRGVFDV